MKVKNYKKYALFPYESKVSKKDVYKLGDIVITTDREPKEIGVILQIHSPTEFRTDMFGNCSTEDTQLASIFQMKKYRPELLSEFDHDDYCKVMQDRLDDQEKLLQKLIDRAEKLQKSISENKVLNHERAAMIGMIDMASCLGLDTKPYHWIYII